MKYKVNYLDLRNNTWRHVITECFDEQAIYERIIEKYGIMRGDEYVVYKIEAITEP